MYHLRKINSEEVLLIIETELIFWNHTYSHLKSKYIFRNKKPRYWADIHPSGYETHAASSILNWLEDEWA